MNKKKATHHTTLMNFSPLQMALTQIVVFIIAGALFCHQRKDLLSSNWMKKKIKLLSFILNQKGETSVSVSIMLSLRKKNLMKLKKNLMKLKKRILLFATNKLIKALFLKMKEVSLICLTLSTQTWNRVNINS